MDDELKDALDDYRWWQALAIRFFFDGMPLMVMGGLVLPGAVYFVFASLGTMHPGIIAATVAAFLSASYAGMNLAGRRVRHRILSANKQKRLPSAAALHPVAVPTSR